MNKFTYLGNSVSSTENDINRRLAKTWTAINRLSVIWMSDRADKIKRSFFKQRSCRYCYMDANKMYGEKAWWQLHHNATSCIEQVLETTKKLLYCHLPPITKTIQVRRTIHVGNCWRSKDEPIYNKSLLIQDISRRTSRERWTIEMGDERGSERSVLAVWHDDLKMYVM